MYRVYMRFVLLSLLGSAMVVACLAIGGENKVNSVESKFVEAGLVDLQTLEPTIQVKVVNSDSGDNIFGQDFYHGLKRAYLLKTVAKKLKRAQKFLKAKHPGHSLLIMDAARPNSVSAKMFDDMKGTRFEKYVANPKKGSMHNYGAAVDITIIDEDGDLVDMGFCPFYKSKIGVALSYLFSGKPNKEQAANRKLLKKVMVSAGFHPLAHEWWHFNGLAKPVVRKNFRIIK